MIQQVLNSYWSAYSSCINHSGYANNYDYNKAIYLVNRQKFHDMGFLLMKEDRNLSRLFLFLIMNIIIQLKLYCIRLIH